MLSLTTTTGRVLLISEPITGSRLAQSDHLHSNVPSPEVHRISGVYPPSCLYYHWMEREWHGYSELHKCLLSHHGPRCFYRRYDPGFRFYAYLSGLQSVGALLSQPLLFSSYSSSSPKRGPYQISMRIMLSSTWCYPAPKRNIRLKI